VKIAFLTEYYAPDIGGVASSAGRITRSLAEAGIKVAVYCWNHRSSPFAADSIVSEKEGSLEVHRVGPTTEVGRGRNLHDMLNKNRRRAVSSIIRHLEQDPPDIVMGFYLLQMGYLAVFVARHFQVPLVEGIRGNDLSGNLFTDNSMPFVEFTMRAANRIVPVNENLRRWSLLAFPELEDKVQVIPNSTPVLVPEASKSELRARLLKKTGWPEDSLILTFVGGLREKKGAFELLKAVRRAAMNHPVRLLVLGWKMQLQDMGDAMKSWRKLQQADIAWCTGEVPPKKMPARIYAGDVILFPSKEDGMANGLLEGMALGLCPIVSEIFTDVVSDGQTGYVTPTGDEQALQLAIEDAAQHRDKVVRLGEAAREQIDSCHRPVHERNRYLALFHELLESAPHRHNRI
jgi:glycosyltransferase involved in cell wall biosynthesis